MFEVIAISGQRAKVVEYHPTFQTAMEGARKRYDATAEKSGWPTQPRVLNNGYFTDKKLQGYAVFRREEDPT
jgi:hypothetical protein